jgi:hypothetical protein
LILDISGCGLDGFVVPVDSDLDIGTMALSTDLLNLSLEAGDADLLGILKPFIGSTSLYKPLSMYLLIIPVIV